MTGFRFRRTEQVVLFRAFIAIWLLSYFFHAFEYSLFEINQLELFSFIGGLDEAKRMASSIHYRSAANAFGEHVVVMFFFFIVTSTSLVLLLFGQVLAFLGSERFQVLSRAYLGSTALVFAICTFVLFSPDFTMFFGDDPRTKGGSFWLKLMLYSIGWPILAIVSIDGLVNPNNYTKRRK